MGIHRGHQARPVERVFEWLIFGVSFSTIAIIFLIFIFVGKEALPVVFGKEDSAAIKDVIPSADIEKISAEKLREYLDLTPAQFKEMDKETLVTLMQVREEALAELPEYMRTDKDARINTTEWRYQDIFHTSLYMIASSNFHIAREVVEIIERKN